MREVLSWEVLEGENLECEDGRRVLLQWHSPEGMVSQRMTVQKVKFLIYLHETPFAAGKNAQHGQNKGCKAKDDWYQS